MDIGNYIKQLRLSKGLSQEELGKIVGVQRAAVQKWEAGKVQNLKRETIKKLSEFFKVNPSMFIDADETEYASIPNILPMPKMKKVPRLGAIACGEPILAEENFEGYDDAPDYVDCDFTLECKGDSMVNARINDGDVVYIKCQSVVENGEIAAVMVDGETTLKRVYVYDNKVVLQAENPKYEPYIYVDEELNNIRVIGKAVGFFSYIK